MSAPDQSKATQAGPTSPQPAIEADAFNAFEAAGWQRQAPTYDEVMGRVTSRLVDPLVEAAGVGPGMHVLDVATGPGYAAVAAARRDASVVGVDVSPAMVALARRLHRDLDFRQAAAEKLPFAQGSFDAVISNFVVPHLGRPERSVNEFVRVLRPGGRLALTTWDVPDRMRLLGVLLDAIAEAGATPPDDIPVGPPFFRYASDEDFVALLKAGGLVGIRIQTIAFQHPVATGEELWHGLMGGTVRMSALVLRQPDEIRQRIRSAFDQAVVGYRRGARLELPVSVKLAAGSKPPSRPQTIH